MPLDRNNGTAKQLAVWAEIDGGGSMMRLERSVGRLAVEYGLLLDDGRVLNWPCDAARPTMRRIHSVPLTAALDDVEWGIILATILQGVTTWPGEPGPGRGPAVLPLLSHVLKPGWSCVVAWGDKAHVDRLATALTPHSAQLRAPLA
jgi:hypothetical protein